MLFDDYVQYTATYQEKYGPKTLVLMEVGSFFELYGVTNATEKLGADVQVVCDLLNIQMSRKNKAILENSRGNPLMAGFPEYVLQKFLDILVAHGYTVVLVEQVTPPPQPKREVTRIVSPSTYVQHVATVDKHWLMCIHVSLCHDPKQRTPRYIFASAALLDMTTGDSLVYEPPQAFKDDAVVCEDLQRLVLTYRPKEVVVVGEGMEDTVPPLLEAWMRSHPSFLDKLDSTPSDLFKHAYQMAVLKKAFPQTGLLSPIEYLDFERSPHSLAAFVYVIAFAYEHSEKLVRHLQTPQRIRMEESMVLANRVVELLNILPGGVGGSTSLLTLLNKCETSMGKRLFQHRLLHPISNVAVLQQRYEAIELCRTHRRYVDILRLLSPIYDVERLQRKMLLQWLQPCEAANMYASLQAGRQLYTWLDEHGMEEFLKGCDMAQHEAWMLEWSAVFDMDELAKYTLASVHTSFFLPGVHPDIDALQAQVSKAEAYFGTVLDQLNGREPIFKADVTDKGERHITVTKKRYEAFKAPVEGFKAGFTILGTKPVSTSQKSVLRVLVSEWYEKQDELVRLQAALTSRVRGAYEDWMQRVATTYNESSHAWSEWIAAIDVAAACAKASVMYHYHRPSPQEEDNNSYLKAEGMRHPLIEQLQQDVAYVGNDVVLGTPESQGMLLYGINAVGKSSLMKSIGVNVILAQAGMYVACKSMDFVPFRSLFTRLPGGDNLFKGHSTFVAEMLEIRNILKQVGPRSLVIGDELCSGTESVSAVSIVAAGIMSLLDKRTAFVFATHLHELAELNVIKHAPGLSIMHMSVEFSSEHGLVYDRKLRPGPGSTLYGLEVCKSLDLDPTFLHMANQVRQAALGMSPEFVRTKASRYNSRVYMDECDVCRKPCEEVHHIGQQKDADADGFLPNHVHKDHKSNLMRVCAACHDAIHSGSILVEGYVTTSEGVVLRTTSCQKAPSNSYSSSLSLRECAIRLHKEGQSIAAIVKHVATATNEKVTRYQVQKWLK